ncbi:MAG: MerR family transcriptional regulator [Deltaproteobacteria bacterium]|nr:MerR family transcriptional regulator [Deltaproteobacteria bacterium]
MTAHSKLLPNKLYFRIGEVSEIVGVKPYVLRYWETEFPDIKPAKSRSGQRLYKRRDVELLLKVRELLYEQRYTIDGAKHRLKEHSKEYRDDAAETEKAQPVSAIPVGANVKKAFQQMKRELESVLHELRG